MAPLHLLLLDLCTALIWISNDTAVFTALGLKEALSYVLNHIPRLPFGSQYYRKSLKHLELPKGFRDSVCPFEHVLTKELRHLTFKKLASYLSM